MKFGIARDLITPDIKMTMAGYGTFYGTTYHGINDDLYVKALWMHDGSESLLLITVDLLFHEPGLTAAIKQYAAYRYGIKPDYVIISYTHTHSGPAIKGYDLGQHSEHYEAFLQARIQSCIDRLFQNTFEGSLSYGFIEGEWNVNRRKPVEGKMENAPNPDGITDNRLQMLKITGPGGQLKGLFLNYACHPVTIRDTLYLSADFPGRICQYLDTHFYGSTSLFFQGAGGNSRPRITASGSKFVTQTFNQIDEMSVSMANRIQKEVAFGSFEPVELKLAAKQFIIPLELDVYDKEEFAKVAHNEKMIPTSRNGARYVLDHYEEIPDTLPLQGGIVRLSDEVYIAALGGEPCVEVKINIEKAFAGKKLLFIGYLDSIAYIPDDKVIAEGGYEAGEGSVFEMALKGRIKSGIDQNILTSFQENRKYV